MCAVVFTLFAIFASAAAGAPALAVSALAPVAPAMRHLATACAGSTLNHTDSDTTSTDLSAADCAAWQEGYDELGGGARWIKCGDKRDPCGCSGVVCVGGNITSVWLNENNMAGSPPSAFSKLTQLTTLILHGKDDPRVHPSQSLELYRQLKLVGQAPVRLVLYPGEGHGNAKSASRLDYALRTLRWMEHYLKGAGGDPPDPDIDYASYLPWGDDEDEDGDDPPETIVSAAR